MNTGSFGWSGGGGGGGAGTVTSVGLSMPTEYAVTNSPVTNSGTLTVAWQPQLPNLVFASPDGGSSPFGGIPFFRALVLNDMPPEVIAAVQSISDTYLFRYYNFI